MTKNNASKFITLGVGVFAGLYGLAIVGMGNTMKPAEKSSVAILEQVEREREVLAAQEAAILAAEEAEKSTANTGERVTSFRSSLSYTDQLLYDVAQRQVNECDRNWMPASCAKMRAEFKSEFGWEL